MLEVELSNAAIKRDFPTVAPENGQCLGFCSGGEDNVHSSQHTEEKIHRLMEAALDEDDEDEQAISKEGKDVGDEERDGNPHVQVFSAWNAQQIEDYMVNTAVGEVLKRFEFSYWLSTLKFIQGACLTNHCNIYSILIPPFKLLI